MNKQRKNLATCKPSEFLVQANRIRKHAEKWMKVTDIIEIRKQMPTLINIPANATQEQVDEIKKQNDRLVQEQAGKNISLILDSIMEEHAQETLEMLALLCFVEPSDVDNHSVAFYLANLADVLNDKDVISFFTSLVQLDRMNSLNV